MNRKKCFVANTLCVASKMVLLMMFILVMGGCSVSQKAIKSGDPERMYDRAMELYEAEEWKKAATMFETVSPYYMGTDREDFIAFCRARCFFKDSDFEISTMLMDDFRRTYGRSEYLEDIEGMYTLSFYYLSPSPDRDQQMTLSAMVAIEEFLSRYPSSKQCDAFREMLAELEGKLHKKSYVNAYTYYKIGRYKSAIVAFKNAIKEYPDSEFREDLLYYVVASSYELSRNSINSKKEDRYLAMMDSYYTFIAEFPDSEYRPDVDVMLKRARKYIEDKKLGLDQEEEVRVVFWKRIFGKKKSTSEELEVKDPAMDRVEAKEAEKVEAARAAREEKRKK